MTNKQIIDGVDVSECEDYGYRGKAGYWCHNYDEPCTDYPNCNYKQLKRKEQECNKLCIQLKADEEYHKEEENTLRKIIKNESKRYKKEIGKLKATKEQSEQKLKRIRDICENYCELMCLGGTIETCKNCINTEVLQIIDEVENES